MTTTTYSIMLYHEDARRYEYLTEMSGTSSAEALRKFRAWAKWVDKKGTKLFAKPPICR